MSDKSGKNHRLSGSNEDEQNNLLGRSQQDVKGIEIISAQSGKTPFLQQVKVN
jgi:hypothetical protein